MLEVIWGLKTQALFDVWSIEHVLSGVSAGSSVIKHHDRKQAALNAHIPSSIRTHMDYVAVLLLAFWWETIEHYLETGLAGPSVEFWFQGVEFWGNRLITDPLLVLGGYMIAKKYPKCVWPARIFSVAWLLIHIFVFPHSMYLHEIL